MTPARAAAEAVLCPGAPNDAAPCCSARGARGASSPPRFCSLFRRATATIGAEEVGRDATLDDEDRPWRDRVALRWRGGFARRLRSISPDERRRRAVSGWRIAQSGGRVCDVCVCVCVPCCVFPRTALVLVNFGTRRVQRPAAHRRPLLRAAVGASAPARRSSTWVWAAKRSYLSRCSRALYPGRRADAAAGAPLTNVGARAREPRTSASSSAARGCGPTTVPVRRAARHGDRRRHAPSSSTASSRDRLRRAAPEAAPPPPAARDGGGGGAGGGRRRAGRPRLLVCAARVPLVLRGLHVHAALSNLSLTYLAFFVRDALALPTSALSTASRHPLPSPPSAPPSCSPPSRAASRAPPSIRSAHEPRRAACAGCGGRRARRPRVGGGRARRLPGGARRAWSFACRRADLIGARVSSGAFVYGSMARSTSSRTASRSSRSRRIARPSPRTRSATLPASSSSSRRGGRAVLGAAPCWPLLHHRRARARIAAPSHG